jgi:hypothetical protein
MTKLQNKFKEFDDANPQIWELFVKYTQEVISAGKKRYSSKAVFERIRWHTNIETQSDVEFKLSNNHTAYYARKYMEVFPEMEGFFKIKELRGEK